MQIVPLPDLQKYHSKLTKTRHFMPGCPPKFLVGWTSMHLAPPITGLYFRMFSNQIGRRSSILKEELVNGNKNFNTEMCKLVFDSLLNVTHITQLFLFVPNPNVVAYRPLIACRTSVVARGPQT